MRIIVKKIRGKIFKNHIDKKGIILYNIIYCGVCRKVRFIRKSKHRLGDPAPSKNQRQIEYAGMAELADALDSGSSEVTFVQVQVLLPAPTKKEALCLLFCWSV